ncbi:MAG TPA: TolC family protein, partial [Puia sp.]|nr:TolC family protein [Puia sp.]
MIHPDHLYPQDSSKHAIHTLSLNDVIRIARAQNKLVKASKEEEKASAFELQDARDEVLPNIGVTGAYQRYSKVTVFENGFSGAHSLRRPPDPNSASLVTDAGFLIYGGGRVKKNIGEKQLQSQLARVNTNDQAGETATQAALLYLQIVSLSRQDSLIAGQIRRALIRVKNIRSLYQNQRVTRSDLLRAEVDLSSQQLTQEQTENDISIARDKLAIQLDLPASAEIVVADTSFQLPAIAELPVEYTPGMPNTPYALQRFTKQLQLQENKIGLTRSQYYPSVQLFSAYSLNYPNFNVWPYVNDWWALGFIGVKVHYDLSSLYHVKNKVASAKQQYESLR